MIIRAIFDVFEEFLKLGVIKLGKVFCKSDITDVDISHVLEKYFELFKCHVAWINFHHVLKLILYWRMEQHGLIIFIKKLLSLLW